MPVDAEAIPFHSTDNDSLPLRERLERLFGRYWQAGLEQAGILSRRRAREIGAGDEAAPALVAAIELLERTPLALWPARWHGLGKHSDRCPGLESRQDAMNDGRLDPDHAVTVWDSVIAPGERRKVRNIAVGVIPAWPQGAPTDHPARLGWRLWNRQWTDAHGGGTLAENSRGRWQRPAGILAAWIADGNIDDDEVERAIRHLTPRVHGFSERLVMSMADERRHREGPDDE